MFKISGDPALVSEWQNLITAFAKRTFNFGRYSSIDDILDNLGVEVELIKGKEIYRIKKKELDAIEKFWNNVFNSKEIEGFDIWKILDECNKAEKNKAEDNNDKDNNNEESISVSLRGCYIPDKKVIKLYPDEMKDKYGGKRMEELIISTLAHETMHAYFNRPGHDIYPYLVIVEEPLAEFGMLLYLKETNCVFYDWAKADTEGYKTCYRYGAKLMDLYIGGKKQFRSILEAYKPGVDFLLQSWMHLFHKLNFNP